MDLFDFGQKEPKTQVLAPQGSGWTRVQRCATPWNSSESIKAVKPRDLVQICRGGGKSNLEKLSSEAASCAVPTAWARFAFGIIP